MFDVLGVLLLVLFPYVTSTSSSKSPKASLSPKTWEGSPRAWQMTYAHDSSVSTPDDPDEPSWKGVDSDEGEKWGTLGLSQPSSSSLASARPMPQLPLNILAVQEPDQLLELIRSMDILIVAFVAQGDKKGVLLNDHAKQYPNVTFAWVRMDGAQERAFRENFHIAQTPTVLTYFDGVEASCAISSEEIESLGDNLAELSLERSLRKE